MLNVILAIIVLFIQLISFVYYIPHITLLNSLSSQDKDFYGLLLRIIIYASPFAGAGIIYFIKKKRRDGLTFLAAVFALDFIVFTLPVTFHWLYWLINN